MQSVNLYIFWFEFNNLQALTSILVSFIIHVHILICIDQCCESYNKGARSIVIDEMVFYVSVP